MTENKDYEEIIDENVDEVLENDIENETPIEEDVDSFDDYDVEEASANSSTSYVKLSDKYEDVKSSAYTMLGVGSAGIIFMILVLMKVVELPITNSDTGWLFYSVMGIVFVAFVAAGIVSLKHSAVLKEEADIEDKLIDKLLEWADEEFTKDKIDEGLDLSQPEEILYFNRAEVIKNSIMHEFENIDEPLVEEMIEQIYNKIYE